jgi:hypothetical protein
LLNFEGSLRDGNLAVSTLNAEYSGFRLDNTRIDYSLGQGFFNMSALLHSSAGTEQEVTWAIYGNVEATSPQAEKASAANFFDRLRVAAIQGGLRVSTTSPRVSEQYRDWNVRVRREGGEIRLTSGSNQSLEGIISESGDFSLALRRPFPITFEAEGKFSGGLLEANVNRIAFNVEDFSWLLDFEILRLTRGQATGNLRVFGPPEDPDIYGTVAVRQGWASLKLMPDELGPWEGNLLFREKEFTLPPMHVPAGAGYALVSGLFQLDHWRPARVSLSIDTQDSPGVHIVNNFNGVDINGIAQGLLTVDVDTRYITVNGNIMGSNVIISMAEEEQKPANPPQYLLVVNMQMETGRAVEFNWQIFGMPVLQTYANMGEKIKFTFQEETADFRLEGDINLRGGEIFWFDRRFFIREGLVRLDERAGSFDPRLTVRAEMRENTEDGLVRIYLIADNTRFSQFSPRFESDKGFTNSEILTVLGKNVLGTSGEEALNIASAVPYTGDILAQVGIIKTVEKGVRDALRVDLFSVRTHLVQNLLQGVITPQQQQQEIERRGRDDSNNSFGRYLDKSSVFMGKYIGSDLFMNFLLQFRVQDVLVREEDAFGGMVIDAEFMLEFRTPFFLLEWSLLPKHPNELFIFDNIFTFRWRFPL